METQNELSERAVIDWLKWKATTYGIPGLYLKIEDTEDNPCLARTTTDDEAFGCGNTFDHAVTMIRPRIKTPQCKADELRQQAAKLLEKSNRILGFPKPFPSQGAGSSQEDASAAREGAAGCAKEVRHV